MKKSFPWLALLIPAVAFGQAGAPSLARIGAAGAVRGVVKAESKGTTVGRIIQSGKPLFLNDHVTTDKAGRLQVLLLDETSFTLGPDSDMVLDEFVYNPADESGKVAARVTKGVFRFVTGKVARKDPSKMQVKLPVGTVGIRGTMAIGQADANSSTVILLGPGSHGNSDESRGSIRVDHNGQTRDIENPGDGVTCQAGQNCSKVGDLSRRAIELSEIISPSAEALQGSDDSEASDPTRNSGQAIARGLVLGQGFEQDPRLDNTLSNAVYAQNGPARWDDVRSLESGSGTYIGSGFYTCTANCTGQGSMNFSMNINFGAKTLGGGSSAITVTSNATLFGATTSIGTISYANLGGPATVNLTPVVGSEFSGTQVSLANSNGVIANDAIVDVKYLSLSFSDAANGTMMGSR